MRRRTGGRRGRPFGRQGSSRDQTNTLESQCDASTGSLPTQQGPIIWHYTVGRRYDQILAEGELQPRGANFPGEGKHAVWFTKSDRWEATADKMTPINIDGEAVLVRLNTHLTHLLLNGLVRIGVAPEVAPFTWHDYKRLSGVSRDMARDLYRIAVKRGSRLCDWRISFDAIPRSQWLAIEFWNGRDWSTDPNVRPKHPPYREGLIWILDGIKSGEVTTAMGVDTAKQLGVRVGT